MIDRRVGTVFARAGQHGHAVDRFHAQVGQHDVEAAARQQRERLGAAARRSTTSWPAVRQGRLQQGHQLRLVIDDQDPGQVRVLSPSFSAARAGSSGSVITASAPRRSDRSRSSSVPPISSTMRREMASPRPLPFSFVVRNGSNSRCRSRPPRPVPSSGDRHRTAFPSADPTQSMHQPAARHRVARVEQQVEAHLLQSTRIAADQPAPGNARVRDGNARGCQFVSDKAHAARQTATTSKSSAGPGWPVPKDR